ncbi:MAG: 4Fe-4S ferredoxin [Desulfarculaceae bacterium]|nr:4Fe-4S ferredoxin [Desulfarculaceae bacterium]MCF8071027.1 4Fe-4S ferredoxin [Desulfarculaceae bacterium]MCF8100615.1 4Fe-4S ferredoxin [Desulfarculaceae bacterium]MCF8116951.1 4Fe-4S ferredoxin [Desulfarculaceae bacterium]
MRKTRDIIEIDQELCNGCGQCILDCAEGALKLVDGKAKLVGEIYCDGLGACLSGCPTGALTVVQREAEDFDEEAVEELLAGQAQETAPPAASTEMPMASGCAGQAAMSLEPAAAPPASGAAASQLGHWPIKLQLLSPQAPFLQGADLLLLADCAAAALPDLHAKLLPGRAIALACPKLDDPQAHVDKLAELLAGAQVRSLTVVRMEVPCCGGLNWIVEQALAKAGKSLPLGEMVIGRGGQVLSSSNLPWDAAA